MQKFWDIITYNQKTKSQLYKYISYCLLKWIFLIYFYSTTDESKLTKEEIKYNKELGEKYIKFIKTVNFNYAPRNLENAFEDSKDNLIDAEENQNLMKLKKSKFE